MDKRRCNLLCPVIAIIIFSGFYFLFSGLYFQKPSNRTYSQTPHFNGVKEFQQHFREADEKRLDELTPTEFAPKFLLVKIVANNFPPLQTKRTMLRNVEDIKKIEKLPGSFHRIWVLHSILDKNLTDQIWAKAFTDAEMTLMVPSPFDISPNRASKLTPESVKEAILNVNSARLLAIETALTFFNSTWVILADGQSYLTPEAMELVPKALEKCGPNPDCFMHCIPKYTTHSNIFSEFLEIRNSYWHSGEQQQCQPAFKMSFLRSNSELVKSWFNRTFAPDLNSQDQFDYHPQTISEVLKAKKNSSCMHEAWINSLSNGKRESITKRVQIAFNCGYVLRQPFNFRTISNRTYKYDYKEVIEIHKPLRKEAIDQFDEFIRSKLVL